MEIYVDEEKGNDLNPGTFARPIKTKEKAQALVAAEDLKILIIKRVTIIQELED